MPLALDEENDAELLQTWLEAARECVDHWDQHRQFTIPGSRIRKFNVCYPFAAHSINQVRATLQLIDSNSHYMARVNARVAFEHAMIAQWVILTYNGEEAVVRKTERYRRATITDLQRVTELPLELANELNSPLEGAELPSIQDICDRFDKGTRSVYSLYRQLTDSVHVSLATVLAYMKIGDGGVEGLLSHPATKQDRDLFLATGWSAVLAMDAIESLRKGRPFRSVIRKLAQSHTLTSDLASADSKPHLQRRPQE